MAQTDAINNKFIIPQQNYYSGVKIDIHNPTVNVPNNTDGYAKPDFQIYQYDTKPINVYQPPYIPTIQAPPKEEVPTNTTVKTPLPEAQPVKELPESVLKPIKIATRTTITIKKSRFSECLVLDLLLSMIILYHK